MYKIRVWPVGIKLPIFKQIYGFHESSFVDTFSVPLNKAISILGCQFIRFGEQVGGQTRHLMRGHKPRMQPHTRMGESLYQIPVERVAGVQSIEAKPKLLIHRKILDRKSTRLNSSHLVISYAV